MKKYLFLALSILLIFFITDRVEAFTVKDYDTRLSLFDGFENNIPVCDKDTTITDEGALRDSSGNNRVCYKGTVPSLDTLVEYLPYITRYEYKIKGTNTIYYVWTFNNDIPVIQSQNYISPGPDFIISTLPEEGFITTVDGNVIALNNGYTSPPSGYVCGTEFDDQSTVVKNTSTFCNAFPFFTSTWNIFTYFLFDNSNPYFDITVSTNYDLKYKNADEIIVNATTGHEFYTDIDITVPINNYLLLIPKKNTEFSSYLWTDSNFAYSEMYYDEFNSTYSNITGGGLNEINFGSLGGFNWLRWDFSFSDLDLSLKKVIMLFNHSSNELHIKIFSDDFYYRLMDSTSSDYCVGDLCYKNDYYNFKNFAYSTGSINNKYNTDDYDSGLSFIQQIPDMVQDFTKSFAFIGILFITTFSVFAGSIANYFYVIFGLMIIMLIIKILK